VVSGLVCGLGIAVLLQQFAVVALSTTLLVGLPVGMALLGLALGWPRGGRAAVGTPAGEPGEPGEPAAAPAPAQPEEPPAPAPAQPADGTSTS
jgi:hypothetical protein